VSDGLKYVESVSKRAAFGTEKRGELRACVGARARREGVPAPARDRAAASIQEREGVTSTALALPVAASPPVT